MTLFRQLLMVILLGFAANLIGVLWLEFNATRQYLSNQLESDLNNTSTSLSMVITPQLTQDDPVMLDSMLTAYFDGGYYELIEIENFSNDEVIRKKAPVRVNKVPRWFVEMELIKVPTVTTTLTDGWLQVGKLTIKGHPGFAYKSLWDALVAMTSWMGSLTLLMVFLASIGIKVVLNPLARISRKAEELQERRFTRPLPLPRTRELNRLTTAINNMASRVQEQFEEEAKLHDTLKAQAFLDDTTGFGNRRYFNQQLHSWLYEAPLGAVIFIELSGLEKIKTRDGWLQRDEVVRQAAAIIDECFDATQCPVKYRLSANEFALILEGVDQSQSEDLLNILGQRLSDAEFTSQFYQPDIFQVGVAIISASDESSRVLAMVDSAMQQAGSQPSGIFICHQSEQQSPAFSKEQLKQVITEAINHSQLRFTRQPVYAYADDQQPLHYEVFVQVLLGEVPALNSSQFFALVDEQQLGHDFDKKVIEQLLSHLAGGDSQCYAINLTGSALEDPAFSRWLVAELAAQPQCRQQLCFEFTEETALKLPQQVGALCHQLKALGVTFGVDRVGRHFSSLSYLQAIHPDYVKIDHGFTHSALQGEDDGYFVASLCATIHNLDIDVIATRVEEAHQLALLKNYHFNGYQGYIAKPEPFELNSEAPVRS